MHHDENFICTYARMRRASWMACIFGTTHSCLLLNYPVHIHWHALVPVAAPCETVRMKEGGGEVNPFTIPDLVFAPRAPLPSPSKRIRYKALSSLEPRCMPHSRRLGLTDAPCGWQSIEVDAAPLVLEFGVDAGFYSQMPDTEDLSQTTNGAPASSICLSAPPSSDLILSTTPALLEWRSSSRWWPPPPLAWILLSPPTPPFALAFSQGPPQVPISRPRRLRRSRGTKPISRAPTVISSPRASTSISTCSPTSTSTSCTRSSAIHLSPPPHQCIQQLKARRCNYILPPGIDTEGAACAIPTGYFVKET
ncbi:hypothetical protein R3P38DRAFT_3574617 [Favolaschia claudopus]|uniref:Uncharacterized protein n=1 Tax=Favolaschia claudopus TaxID=2862362 RepID=A0AAW0APP6_9AGAR